MPQFLSIPLCNNFRYKPGRYLFRKGRFEFARGQPIRQGNRSCLHSSYIGFVERLVQRQGFETTRLCELLGSVRNIPSPEKSRIREMIGKWSESRMIETVASDSRQFLWSTIWSTSPFRWLRRNLEIVTSKSLSPEGFESWLFQTGTMECRLPARKHLGLKFKSPMMSASLQARLGNL
jgi:hypothetical protein